MKLFKKAKKGFTLVELVVVIAVIAILAAVSVGAYFGVTESANNSRLEQEAKQVYTAIQTVSLAPNDHSSLNKTGLTITDAGKFELAIESNLGIDVALTDEQNIQDPTKPTICFVTPSVSPKLGGDTVYETFYYYNHEIGGKLAVGDILSGECKAQNPDGEIINKDILDNDKSFNLVTSVSEIGVGDKIIIVAKESNVALSTTQNNNNRGQVEIERNDDVVIINDEVQIFEIEAGSVEGSYAFNTGGGYLYAASSSANHLKTQSEINDNSSWKIEINEGTAVITAQGTYTRNVIQYNSNSSLFACYGSTSQQEVAIYRFGTYVPCEHDFGDNLKTCTKCGEENPNYEAPAAITTIPEALEAELEHPVVLDGTVTEIYEAWNDTHDNMSFYIQDAEENQILVFRCNTKVIIGDIVTVTGEIGEHGGVNQVAKGSTAEVKGHDSSYDPVDYITNIPAALTAEDGEYVQLEGEVISLDEGSGTANVTITDGTNSIYAYKMSVQDGQTLSVHDIIVITGQMSTYNSNRQISASTFVDTGRKGDHDYTEATCFEASTCTLCGDVNGNPLDHTDTLDNDGYCDLCHWDLNATTVSKTIEQLITSEEWTPSTTKQSFKLNDIVSVKVNGGDYSGNAYTDHIRIYATDTPAGSLTISVPEGVTLTSVKISTKTDSDYAYLCVGEDTTNDISNVTTNISGTSVNLNTIKNGDDGKHVRVTAIEVSYRILDTSKGYLTEITANPESLNFTSDVAQNISILAQYSVEKDIDVDENLVTWESNDKSVATVSVEGLVTPVANGSASIIATYLGVSVEIPVTVALPTQGGSEGEENPETPTTPEINLVTSNAELEVGSKIIIAAKDNNVALSTTQNSNNRGQTEIPKNGDSLDNVTESVEIFTLENGTADGSFAFNTGDGYLYAASSSKNYLRTQPSKDSNSSWSIDVETTGVATIKAQGTNTNNWLRYNSSSKIFSCYSDGQGDVIIYKISGDIQEGTPSLPETPSDKISTLDRTFTGMSGTSYSEWEGKSDNNGITFAGNSAGGNDSIQLRSDKSNSGIVTTGNSNEYKVAKITIVRNSNTTSGRKLDIYGKNAYA